MAWRSEERIHTNRAFGGILLRLSGRGQSPKWLRAASGAPFGKHRPNLPQIGSRHVLLGTGRFRLGDVKGAEEILAQAATLAPDSVEVRMQLGFVHLNRGRAKEAQACFRAAIRAKPNLGEAWFNLGLSLGADTNHRAESMAAFREAIRLKPNLIEAYLGLAVILRAEGQKEKSAYELRRALSLQPEEPLRQKLLDQLKLVEQP